MNIQHTCFPFMVLAAGILLFTSCHSGPNIPQETPTSGTIHISVDESFKPVIDSQLKVFESSFPDARILVDYKPEAACLRDIYNDSTRMIIITRGLSLPEERYFRDTAKTPAVSGILAFDAVALVVNNHSRDTVMSMDEVRALLEGNDPKKRDAVMDGVTATSTVRYAMDSILKGRAMGKNVMAARSSPQVISYVADHENAVGFIGVNWIGDQEDSMELAFLKKVKVVAIRCDRCTDQPFVYPLAANIVLKKYPMVRGLYYILKENYSGIGNNFVNFLQYERGQLIFKRSYLVPARMSFEIRDAEIQQ
ncbi:MAG TPA: phosphate ABC transporter substrate-binding protein, PhoT family [Chitinophagaceae bacterium]|jgi:phosphate transport system substrate-binding protein|nr:phosphate ABC transporter substrate-binding protein, PhoT family [Chitinophagaceae bacterium]